VKERPVAARDPAVPPMRVEASGFARGALAGDVNRSFLDPFLAKGDGNRERKVERRALPVRLQDLTGKILRHLRPDGVTTGMDAGADRSEDFPGGDSGRAEETDRTGRDPIPGSAPSRMEESAQSSAPRDEHHRRAVGGRHRHPRISSANDEPVRVARSLVRPDDPGSVDLAEAPWPRLGNPERRESDRAVLKHRLAIVSHLESEIERSVRAKAHAPASRGDSDPRVRRNMFLGGAPHHDVLGRIPRHAAQRARFVRGAQAASRFATCAALAAALVLAGCARVPTSSSGTAARDRLLASYGAAHGPTRGVGSISVRRADRGRGNARVRWAQNAESLAVVGYVGPSRALDASLRGDSLYIIVRRYGTGVAGSLRGEEGIESPLLRFIATPWDMSPDWVHAALERAELQQSGKGWLLLGPLDLGGRVRGSSDAEYRFTLEVNAGADPVKLTLRRPGAGGEMISVRYGPARRFQAGRIPSWIEWSFSGSVVRLEIEDHAPADASKIRFTPRIEADWMILALDQPGGRSLVRWLLGLSEETVKP